MDMSEKRGSLTHSHPVPGLDPVVLASRLTARVVWEDHGIEEETVAGVYQAALSSYEPPRPWDGGCSAFVDPVELRATALLAFACGDRVLRGELMPLAEKMATVSGPQTARTAMIHRMLDPDFDLLLPSQNDVLLEHLGAERARELDGHTRLRSRCFDAAFYLRSRGFDLEGLDESSMVALSAGDRGVAVRLALENLATHPAEVVVELLDPEYLVLVAPGHVDLDAFARACADWCVAEEDEDTEAFDGQEPEQVWLGFVDGAMWDMVRVAAGTPGAQPWTILVGAGETFLG